MTMPRPASPRDKLQRRCEDLVAAEMTRLSRRVPALSEEHLGNEETVPFGVDILRLGSG
jgi:hypothetical protein